MLGSWNLVLAPVKVDPTSEGAAAYTAEAIGGHDGMVCLDAWGNFLSGQLLIF